jgi:hypothetical protein
MSFRVRGVQATIKKLQRFGQEGENRAKQITAITANEIATKAAQNLSAYNDVDHNGTIAQSINAVPKNNGLTWGISVNQVPMAAYIEFGTGVYVDIPPGWEQIAWKFYVNGLGRLTPHPYLYPAFNAGKRQYEVDLKDALNSLTRRYNR